MRRLMKIRLYPRLIIWKIFLHNCPKIYVPTVRYGLSSLVRIAIEVQGLPYSRAEKIF
jgi:hypothetical protein